jgi:hypothetical protein
MPQLSYNSIKNNGRFSPKNLAKPFLLFILVVGIYAAGYMTPKVQADVKYAPAEKAAHDFIAKVVAGDYAAATNLGTDAFKEKFKDANSLKTALGDLKSDSPQFKDSSEIRVGDYYQYSQVVDKLPPNPAGLTDAGFVLDLVKVGKTWQVASVVVE